MARIVRNYDIEYESSPKKFNISQEVINEMLSKVNIVDVLNNEYGLVLFGGNNGEYTGNCPFPDHRDSTPSFFVNEQKGLYRCFGCGRAGSILNFFMDVDGVGFRTALAKLSELSGVAIEGYDNELSYIISQTISVIDKYINYFDTSDLPCGLSPDMFFKILADRFRQYEIKVEFDPIEIEWVDSMYQLFDDCDAKQEHTKMRQMWGKIGEQLKQRYNAYLERKNK